jgi:hypothetical protein
LAFFRIFFLAAALAGLGWFGFVNTAPAHVLAQRTFDRFDERPPRSILFIGNSRTFDNHMPYMLREMADSANAAEKYQVQMSALPGASFESHWREGRVQRLIAERKWDGIILQAESRAQASDDQRDRFSRYGALLIGEAAASGAHASLLINWVYGAAEFEGGPPGAQEAYYQRIQSDHRALARSSGARLVNVGGAWRVANAANLPFALDTDGNHPSLHGSYLTALMIYAHLSGGDVRDVTWVPSGISAAEAATMRDLVSDFVTSSIAT